MTAIVAGRKPAEVNKEIRYAAYLVYRRTARTAGLTDPAALGAETAAAVDAIEAAGVTVRGLYDVSAMRADADAMIWLLGPTPESIQAAARTFRRTALGRTLDLVWTGVGLHRPAEFNKRHVPMAFVTDRTLRWLTVYPFVRSHEWFLLPDAERAAMLREHGQMGATYPQVQASTISAFAISDYEFVLALESDELHHTVDLMRHLRGAEARRHVRLETPFFTGRRVDPAELVEGLL